MPTKSHQDQKNLLLLTSGGDSPGMNAVIRAVVRSGHYHGFKVYACHDGYQGLVDEKIFTMEPHSVANCIQRGGTIIRSNRSHEFLKKEVRDKCRKFLAQEKIEYMVAIGGDGTYRGAAILEEEGGPKTIGIPGTIDNDIVGTEYTIGFDTARNTALQAIDKIRDTATSNSLYFLVETMGRNSGFLAADVGLAGGAEFVITPEFPTSIPELAKKIISPRRKKQSLIIVVAEADSPGRSFGMAQALKLITPGFEYRVCILGHIQRGGSPTLLDRSAGSIMGNMAVEGLLSGKSRCMTAMQDGKYVLAPFPNPNQPSRRLTDESIIKLTQILAS
ncbi:MAG: ATP-dependent 6-phosphofructokinase [Gammaproteobacteria bacterium]|nr:ATP-dependent 6-phosphofructokinase [Gammaproteobacteria bacterium]